MKFQPVLVSILAGVIFSLGGLVATFFGGLPVAELFGSEGRLDWADVALGIFIVGVLAWWILVGRSGRLSLLRGAIAGALAGIFSYPVVLAVDELFRISPEIDAAVEQAATVSRLSGLGFLTTGFAAVPAMALVGIVATLLLRPFYPALKGVDPALKLLRGVGVVLLVLAGALVALFVGLTIVPLDHGRVVGTGDLAEAPSYEQALASFEATRQREDQIPINPRCASKLLVQENRAAPTVIFLHGLTNCPAQADELAPKLFALGYNVYVPRLPGHGELDRMTTALATVGAEDYVAATEEAIAIGRGLGGEVIVSGLSAGGVLSAWSGQQRADVDQAIAMAPFFGPRQVPAWANRAATNLLLLLPNIMMSWDPQNPEGSPEMDYAYPRVATRALGQFMLIGEVTAELAGRQAPRAQALSVMVNEADTEVNDRLIDRLVAAWQDHGAQVGVKVVPLALGLPHDLIDPRQEHANTEVAYSLFVEMLDASVGR
ncbi:alpha/beta fold hydrolase [Devosia sp.]|uniref:alpha/beta fold hydrolase n=1 Tax=Devosia sp. TaxID=1871048 RepID=UPI001B2A15D4|nr:alpha/beta fold hydrolase [Devosia sp.]MBO9587050.1 alpha/beta fold hydrolase [Devosia sp.]